MLITTVAETSACIVKALLDPGATARSKLQKQARRAAGRKRKLEEVAHARSIGVVVKNKKLRKKAAEG